MVVLNGYVSLPDSQWIRFATWPPRKLVGRDHWSQISEVPQLQCWGVTATIGSPQCYQYKHLQFWWDIPGEVLRTPKNHGFNSLRNGLVAPFLDGLVAALAKEFRFFFCVSKKLTIDMWWCWWWWWWWVDGLMANQHRLRSAIKNLDDILQAARSWWKGPGNMIGSPEWLVYNGKSHENSWCRCTPI